MSKVNWKRRGEWMEDNSLTISGYRLNERNEFIASDIGATILNPVDFDHFTCIDGVEIEGDFPIKFNFGDVTYYCDVALYNALFNLADEILCNSVDTLCNNLGINQGEDLEDTTQYPRLALV